MKLMKMISQVRLYVFSLQLYASIVTFLCFLVSVGFKDFSSVVAEGKGKVNLGMYNVFCMMLAYIPYAS